MIVFFIGARCTICAQ